MSVEPWAESELKGKDIIKESSIFIYCKFIFSFKLPYVVTLSTKGIKMIFKCQSIQSFNLSHHPPGANPWSFEDWCPTQNAPPIFLVKRRSQRPRLSKHWPSRPFFLGHWLTKVNYLTQADLYLKTYHLYCAGKTTFLVPARQGSNSPLPGHGRWSNARGFPGWGIIVSNKLAHNKRGKENGY